jgi:hypothetical protein
MRGPELAIATNLDPGDLGPAVKARAWRALARIDEAGIKGVGDPAEASNDLLEALKLSPETPADTLLAAKIAEQVRGVGRGGNRLPPGSGQRSQIRSAVAPPAWPTS